MVVDLDETGPIYDVMATAIGAELERGSDVAFLCEGDPLLYGSFVHLLERMGERYPCSAIPGIPSVTAAAALALRPLASRDAPLLILPATLSEARLETMARSCPQLVIMKIGRHVAKVRGVLRAAGLLDEALLVENVGLRDERVRSLASVDQDVVGYFSLVIARRAEPQA
jgi:precorrin-2/cobalt-factor-2 C20-methyltransferase